MTALNKGQLDEAERYRGELAIQRVKRELAKYPPLNAEQRRRLCDYIKTVK